MILVWIFLNDILFLKEPDVLNCAIHVVIYYTLATTAYNFAVIYYTFAAAACNYAVIYYTFATGACTSVVNNNIIACTSVQSVVNNSKGARDPANQPTVR